MEKERNLRSADSSGYIVDPVASLQEDFTEITEIHRSARNVVLRAKRFGRWWVLKGAAPDSGLTEGASALRKEFEIALMIPRGIGPNASAIETLPDYGPCIVMDYVEGITLGEWLKGPHTRRQRSDMAHMLTEVVGKIHRCGVVHRDLKPENIIIPTIGNRPVIIDFNLSDTTVHSEFKQPAGTKGYMSPEQFYADKPDPRNDIYSLACLLKEMNLPYAWRRAIKKALRPIDRRYDSTDSLAESVRRTQKRCRFLWRALGAVALVALTALTMLSLNGNNKANDSGAQSQRAEMLSTRFDSISRTADKQIALLEGNLKNIKDSIRNANQAADDRRAAVQAAIKNEKAVLDRIWARTGMRYLDTVDTSGFVANAITTEPMDREARDFVARSSSKFTPEELTVITDALNKHIKTNMDKWTERRYKMIPND